MEEYFSTDKIAETAVELRELGSSMYHHYFMKKLISMSLDRHDREKEMAAMLLSALYVDVIQPDQVIEGFTKLVESSDDLVIDIPDALDILALFVARAIVDDILPPSFIHKVTQTLPEGSKGHNVIHKAEKSYLSPPLHASERILRCWGGGSGWAVEDAKDKIVKLLEEYEAGGDVLEACQCIRDLDMPFFHHEVVKKALVMAMEKQNENLLNLVQECSREGLITSNEMLKGFTRVLDSLEDLALDIHDAKQKLLSNTSV